MTCHHEYEAKSGYPNVLVCLNCHDVKSSPAKEFRPPNWVNPYKGNWPDNDRIIFEHGASAILEAVVTLIEKRIDDGEVHFNGLIYNILAELKGSKPHYTDERPRHGHGNRPIGPHREYKGV